MAKSSVLETDSDGYLRAAEAPIICRNAIIFSFAERGVAGAGCCAAFAWNCSKRAFTCGSSSFNIGQLSCFRVTACPELRHSASIGWPSIHCSGQAAVGDDLRTVDIGRIIRRKEQQALATSSAWPHRSSGTLPSNLLVRAVITSAGAVMRSQLGASIKTGATTLMRMPL